MAFIKKILTKYHELIMYGIFGVLTTLINIVTFYLLDLIHLNIYLNNTIAFIVSVIFAFFTNKIFVFESKDYHKEVLLREFGSFSLGRLFSYFLDMGTIYLLFDILSFNKMFSKIISNILVIIVNYFISKLIVFKKNR